MFINVTKFPIFIFFNYIFSITTKQNNIYLIYITKNSKLFLLFNIESVLTKLINKNYIPQACVITFKLPIGAPIDRKFLHSTDTLQTVVDFVGSLGFLQEEFNIVNYHQNNRPKQNVSSL